MKMNLHLALISLMLVNETIAWGQKIPVDSSVYYSQVRTYVNPVLPGDHPANFHFPIFLKNRLFNTYRIVCVSFLNE